MIKRIISSIISILLLMTILVGCENSMGVFNLNSDTSDTASAVSLETMPMLTTGKGIEKPSGYVLPNTYYGVYSNDYLKSDESNIEEVNENNNWRIQGLKNGNSEKEINAFISETEKKLKNQRNEMTLYIANSFEDPYEFGISFTAECINGYLSIVGSLDYYESYYYSALNYYRVYTATWDLYSGIRLTFPEIFWSNAQFIQSVNNGISQELNKPYSSWDHTYDLIGDFLALPNDFNAFSLSRVFFASGKSVFRDGTEVNFSSYCKDMLVTGELRDMANIWENSSIIYHTYRVYDCTEVGIGTEYDVGTAFWAIDAEKSGIDIKTSKKINDYMFKVFDNISTKALDARYGAGSYYNDWPAETWYTVYDRAYVFFECSVYVIFEDETKEDIDLFLSMIFDYHTGEILELDDIFKQGWREAVKIPSGENVDFDNITFHRINNLSYQKHGTELIYISVVDNVTGEEITLQLPSEYVIINSTR